jgi:hypothetical protein
MTGTPVFLGFDPFTRIVKAGERDRVARFTPIPSLPDELLTQRVTVVAGLPPNIRDCEEITLTLKVAAEDSYGGQLEIREVKLYPPKAGSATVALKFRKPEPKTYLARVTVVTDSVTEMPWFECRGDYLYVGAERLPGSCVTMRATGALLAQAAIDITITGWAGGVRTAKLTKREPAITFMAPESGVRARLTVEASDPTGVGEPLRLDLPWSSISLDLPAFPQYGTQTTLVAVRFLDGAQSAEFEFLPQSGDGDGEVIGLRFTPERASVMFSYFATHLFRNRYRFRRSGGDREVAWSDYQTPGLELKLPIHGDADA